MSSSPGGDENNNNGSAGGGGGGGGDDNQNRRSSSKQVEDAKDSSEDCNSSTSFGPSISSLISEILEGNEMSDRFNNTRFAPRTAEEQRRMLTSILEDAVRICADDDFERSEQDNRNNSSSQSSSPSSDNGDSETNAKRRDLQ